MKTLASLAVALATAAGVPHAYAAEPAGGARSARHELHLAIRSTGHSPAEAAAPRDGARTAMAAAWRSIPFQPGTLPAGVLSPALDVSGILVGPPSSRRTFVFLSSRFVRGPPTAI